MRKTLRAKLEDGVWLPSCCTLVVPGMIYMFVLQRECGREGAGVQPESGHPHSGGEEPGQSHGAPLQPHLAAQQGLLPIGWGDKCH